MPVNNAHEWRQHWDYENQCNNLAEIHPIDLEVADQFNVHCNENLIANDQVQQRNDREYPENRPHPVRRYYSVKQGLQDKKKNHDTFFFIAAGKEVFLYLQTC